MSLINITKKQNMKTKTKWLHASDGRWYVAFLIMVAILVIVSLVWNALTDFSFRILNQRVVNLQRVSIGMTEEEVRVRLGEPHHVMEGPDVYIGERGVRTLVYSKSVSWGVGDDIWVVMGADGRVISIVYPDYHHPDVEYHSPTDSIGP